MKKKSHEWYPAKANTLSKCPTSRNMFAEINPIGWIPDKYLIPNHIKGDEMLHRLSDQQRDTSFQQPPAAFPGSSVQVANPEIVVSASVFRKMSRLYQRDGLFLKQLGVLVIKE